MKRFVCFLFLLLSLNLYSQQEALFSQYMFNRLVINPGYAGSREALSLTLVDRYQWVGIDGAPKTLTFSIHSPLRNDNMALGLYVYNDVIGPVQDIGGYGNYAYRVILGKGRLSFGIQAGIKHYHIDWNKLYTKEAGDIIFSGSVEDKVVPDANFGIYYYTKYYYLGVSSKQLFENRWNIIEEERSQYASLFRHFYGMAGMAIPLNNGLIFRPSTLLRYTPNAPLNIDLNASFLFNDLFGLGVSYRSSNAFIFMFEFNITENLRLGYSYDTYLNQLKAYNKGSHEIMLGFDIGLKRSRMLTPRYF